MSSHLFSKRVRSQLGTKGHSETIFEYLDASAEHHVEQVRALLESWFARYPRDEQARLAAEFRSADDRQFMAAFWELYLHESLLIAGLSVECHPSIPGASARPDFRVAGAGTHFYLEARLVGPSNEEMKARRREAQVRDALDRVTADQFMLSVQLLESSDRSPSGRRLRQEINAWLGELDADAATQIARRNPEELPSRIFDSEGWKFDIRAIPLRSEKRGLPRKAVGVYGPSGVVRVDTAADIRDRLHKKAGRYEQLDAPLVPALLVWESSFADEDRVEEALYGTECVRFNFDFDRGVTDATVDRKLDGVWTTPLDRSGKLVAGALVAVKLDPWSVSRRAPVYWANPLVIPLKLRLPWSTRMPNPDGCLETHGAFDAAAFFKLPVGWPEEEVQKSRI